MKILKIFGLVVGIHVLALLLIFANPGCSSSNKPASPLAETPAAPPPTVSVPTGPSTSSAPASASVSAPLFNPDAPATAAAGAGGTGGGRYVPTRPGAPVAPTLTTEPVTEVTPVETYTVKSGDSLWTIAKKYKLTVPQLTAANNLKSSTVLQAGQKLFIPGKTATAAAAPEASAKAAPGTPKAADVKATSAAPKAEGMKHTVQSGESLSVIAKKYGVKMGDLAVANNISDPAKVRAGMELVIPGWDPKNGKSGKAGASKSAGSAQAPSAQKVTPAAPPTINLDPAPASPPAQPPPPIFVPPVIQIDNSQSAPPPRVP
ncbi:MAG: LysM peptidoglycan-binding domain-containing protein [Verrucomicrobiota bacterium]